jgi:uncharacterized protein YndB with AHSA1/START domain
VAQQVPDRIERELVIAVPRERVWAALTTPEQLSAWFGTAAEVDLRPGGALTFTWASSEPSHTNRALVELVDRPHRFVFRWRPFAGYEALPLTEGPSTRVEFILDDHPAGTRLRVIESGFASLPPELRRVQHESNTEGWARELGELAAYLTAPPDQ